MGFHTHEQRECAVLQFHHHALQGLLGFFHWNFQQTQHDGLVFAQHFARGDTKQNGVSNLTGGSGDCNANGLFAHGVNSRKCCKNGDCPGTQAKG